MNSEMGEFALRQIISSLVVVGPLLLIIAGFNYVFNQSKKAVMIYLVAGVIATTIGAVNLYRQFNARSEEPPRIAPAVTNQAGEQS